MKKVLCILLTVLFLLTACQAPEPAPGTPAEDTPAQAAAPAVQLSPGDDGFRYEGGGFDTPEDAVLYYLAGLKNLDLEQMLRAFAWETQAERYSYRDFAVYGGGFDPNYAIPEMPFENDLMRSANLESLRENQIRDIYMSLAAFVNPAMFGENYGSSVVYREGEADIDEYIGSFDPDRMESLAEMQNVRFYSADDVTGNYYTRERGAENFRNYTARFGADEVRDMVAVADVRDETIGVAPTAARYGDRWYLVTTDSIAFSRLPRETILWSGFAVLPGELKEALQLLTPVSAASLPEGKHDGFRYEGGGFDTPEEAVQCYLEGLKNGNVQQMLRAFAWETQAGWYSVKDYFLNISGQISLLYTPGMPPLNDFAQAGNLGILRGTQSQMISKSIRKFILNGEELPIHLASNKVILRSDEETEAFLALFRNDRTQQLAGMANIRTAAPENLVPSYDSQELVRKYKDGYRLVYGADEIRDLIGIADLGSETLFCNPVAARYGEKWYLVSLYGIAFMLQVSPEQRAFFTQEGSEGETLTQLLSGWR